MVNRPLMVVTLSLVLGIAAQAIAGLTPAVPFMAGIAVIAVCVAVFLKGGNAFPPVVLLFFLMGMVLGSAATEKEPAACRELSGPGVFEGYICREPVFRDDRAVYLMQVEGHKDGNPSCGRLLLHVPYGYPVLDYGDRLRVKGSPFLPGIPGNPGQFDYRGYLLSEGALGILAVKEAGDLIRTGAGGGNPAARLAMHVKQKLVESNRLTLPAGHAAVINGIVFGSRGEIDPGTREIFNEAGITHILSVSGLHVGMVAAGLFVLLGMAGLDKYRLPVLTVVLVVYAYLSGLGPAVVRASIMAWMQVLGYHLGRERDWPTTLSASGLVILVIWPQSLFDPGFQLSFGATWGILHLGPLIAKLLEHSGLSWLWLKGSLCVAGAAQVGTIPLVAYYYNTISPGALAANLLAVPLVGVILPLGLVASLAGLVSIRAAWLINRFTEGLLDLLVMVVSLMHNIPGCSLNVVSPPAPVTVAWYGVFFIFASTVVKYGKENWYKGLFATAVAVCLLCIVVLPGIRHGILEVHVLDVGQGDSILVFFPGGRTMLVDTGGWQGEYKSGRGCGEVVAGVLRRKAVRKIDLLVLSHPHEDHAAGAPYLVERFNTGAVLVPAVDEEGFDSPEAYKGYVRMMEKIMNKKVPVLEGRAGQKIKLDPLVEAVVLGPPGDRIRGTGSDLNNNSLVISIRYGEIGFLLTGDIDEEGQKALIESGAAFRHTVLKVPHHGSKNLAGEFIDLVQPVAAVVSVGINSFGQPDRRTLDLIMEGGAELFRTDLDGAITFMTDGGSLGIEKGKQR